MIDKCAVTENNEPVKSMFPSIVRTNERYQVLEKGMTDLRESLYLFKAGSPSMKKSLKPMYKSKYSTRRSIYFSEHKKVFDKTSKNNSIINNVRNSVLRYSVQNNNNTFSPIKYKKKSNNSNNIINSINILKTIENDKKYKNRIVNFPEILLKNEGKNTDINLVEPKIYNDNFNKENIFLNDKIAKNNSNYKGIIQDDKFNTINNDKTHHRLNSIYITNKEYDFPDSNISNSRNSNDNNLNKINFNSAETKNDINKNRILHKKIPSLHGELSHSNRSRDIINNSHSSTDKMDKKYLPKILTSKVREFQLDNNKCNDLLNDVRKKYNRLNFQLGSKFKYANWKYQISDYKKYFIDTESYGEKEREEIERRKTFYDILEDMVDMVLKNQHEKKYIVAKVDSVNEQLEADKDKRKDTFGKDLAKIRQRFLTKHLKKISQRMSMEKRKRDKIKKILNDSQYIAKQALKTKV